MTIYLYNCDNRTSKNFLTFCDITIKMQYIIQFIS